jgi:hypothetical protein
MTKDSDKRRLQKRVFAMCNRANIARSDRIELAKALLDLGEFDIKSYNDLSERDLRDIVFALQSWETVELLRAVNGTQLAQARRLVREADFAPEESLPSDSGLNKTQE